MVVALRLLSPLVLLLLLAMSPGVAAAETPELCLLAAAGDLSDGARVDEVADRLVIDEEYDLAAELYRATLAVRGSDECAARGLAVIADRTAADPAGLQQAEGDWNAFVEKRLTPGLNLALPAGAVLVFLLVLSRLLTARLTPERSTALEPGWSTALWLLGVIACVAAAVAAVAVPSVTKAHTGALGLLVLIAAAAPLALTVGVLTFVGSTAPRPRGAPEGATANLSSLLVLVAVVGVLVGRAGLRVSWQPVVLAVAVVAGLGGTLLVGVTRGQALRLQVDVRGEDGTISANSSSFLMAKLLGLGSSPPSGRISPGQSDVTALPEDALTSLPDGRFAAAVFTILRALIPATPWRATISVLSDEMVVVELVRNRHLIAEAPLTISRVGLGLPAVPEEASDSERVAAGLRTGQALLISAAAYILLELSKRHPELQHGLCGTTRWASLARHALATRTYSDDQPVSLGLLKAAAVIDPENSLTRLALLHETHKHGVDLEEEERLVEGLQLLRKDISEPGTEPLTAMDGYVALEIRILYALTAGQLNCCRLALDIGCHRAAHFWRGGAEAVDALIPRLGPRRKRAEPEPDWGEFLDGMRPETHFLWHLVINVHRREFGGAELLEKLHEKADTVGTWAPKVYERRATASFLHACALMAPDGSQQQKDPAGALRSLRAAIEAGQDRETARVEPFLAPLLDPKHREEFQAIVGEPTPKTLLELEPFTAHAKELTGLGLDTPAALAKVPVSELGEALGVDRLMAQRLRDLASLADSPLDGSGDDRRFGHLQLLIKVGIRSHSELGARLQEAERNKLFEELLKAATTADFLPTQEDTVEAWWTSWKERPSLWSRLIRVIMGRGRS